MNNKGTTTGIVILIAVGIIAALVMFQSIATNVGTSTATSTRTNVTYSLSSTSNYTDIQGCQELIGTYKIYNASTPSAGLLASNITLEEYVGTDGLKTVGFYRKDAVWSGQNVNATYVCGNDGYIENSGSVAVTALILIIAGLAIAVFTMSPVLRDGLSNWR